MKVGAVDYGMRRRRQFGIVATLLALIAFLLALVVFNPDDLIFRLVALALFFTCIFIGNRERYVFNPYYLFSLTPLSLVLYEYKFSRYYLDRLDPYVYMLAILNIAAFIIGLALLKHPVGRSQISEDAKREPSEQRLFYPLLALGMLPVAYGIARAPGVLLSGNFLGMSAYVGLMPMSSILMFCRFPALVLALKSKRRWRIVVALFCCVFALMLSFNKTNLTFLLFSLLFGIHKYCLDNPKAKRSFRVFCVVAVVMMVASVVFYDNIRSDYDSTEALIRTGSEGLPKFLMLPYMYLENSWTNLQYVINTQPEHTWGLWFFRPLLFYFRLDGMFDSFYSLIPASSYNTYTYIAIPWKDFGFFGSLLVSLALGLYVGFVYQKYRRADSPFMTAAWSLNAVAVLEMFFSNHFFYLVYPFTAYLIALLCEAYVRRVAPNEGAQKGRSGPALRLPTRRRAGEC